MIQRPWGICSFLLTSLTLQFEIHFALHLIMFLVDLQLVTKFYSVFLALTLLPHPPKNTCNVNLQPLFIILYQYSNIRFSSIYIYPQSYHCDILIGQQKSVFCLAQPNMSLIKPSQFFFGKPLFLSEVLMEIFLCMCVHTHKHTHTLPQPTVTSQCSPSSWQQ